MLTWAIAYFLNGYIHLDDIDRLWYFFALPSLCDVTIAFLTAVMVRGWPGGSNHHNDEH